MQTIDVLSGGRFEFGIGASWLEEEWIAAQLDFATRGRRVDEAIEVCRRLWSEKTVTHHGEFFSFDEVVVRAEAGAAARAADPRGRRVEGRAAPRRRASATVGSAWGTRSRPRPNASRAAPRLLAEHDRADVKRFEIVLGGAVESHADVTRWEELGVTRLLVSPWRRSSEAIDGLRRFADRAF